jgi:hypothetical protein
MAATESNLWAWLSKARVVLGPDLDMRRIENAVGFGDPDVELCYLGFGCDLELKAAPRPVRGGRLHFGSPMKREQVEWGLKRLAAGGAHGFLIQVGEGADRSVYLVHGRLGPAMLEGGVTEGWLVAHGLHVHYPASAVQYAVHLNNQGPRK